MHAHQDKSLVERRQLIFRRKVYTRWIWRPSHSIPPPPSPCSTLSLFSKAFNIQSQTGTRLGAGDGDSADSTDPTDRNIEGRQNRAKLRWMLVDKKPQQTAQSMRRLKEMHDKTDSKTDVAYETRTQHIRLCVLRSLKIVP